MIKGGEVIMDKSRIIELTQELASVPDTDTGYAKHYILEDIENELYAKPTMPKVFDVWYKDVTAESSDIQGIINSFNSTIDGEYNSYEPERELCIWVHSGKYNRVLGMNLVDETRYKKCLEAILYGYEVED